MPCTALNLRSTMCKLSLVVALALAAAGCADSPAGNTGDRLVTEEVQELLEGLFEIALIGIEEPDFGGEFSGTVDVTNHCSLLPQSGFHSVQGAYQGEANPLADAVEYAGEALIDFFRCAWRIGDGEVVLDGDPGVRVRYEVERVEDLRTYVQDFAGGFLFVTTDGRTGRCAFDLRVQFTLGPSVAEWVVTGSMCGTPGSEIEL